MEKTQFEISPQTIIKAIFIILGIWFLYLIRDVIVILFISLIIVAAIEPTVDFLKRKKIPRSFSVLVIYLLLFTLVGLLFSFLIPSLVNQFKDFSENFPRYTEAFLKTYGGIEKFLGTFGFEMQDANILGDLGSKITEGSANIFSKTIGVFSGFFSFLIVLSLVFYLSVEEDGMQKFVSSFVPASRREYAVSLAERVKTKVGKWLQGQLLLMLIIFILYYIVLSILGVPYALILAVIGGILEIVPYLGPIISTVIATIIGFFISPATGFMVLGGYVIIQQLENNVIVPQIMKKTVGLNPIIVILVLLIGAKIGGTMGAILAIPIATIIGILLEDTMNYRMKNS